MPQPHEETRTVFISWPTYDDVSLSGPKVNEQMMANHFRMFGKFNIEDPGLKTDDKDSNCPSLYVIEKGRDLLHGDPHQPRVEAKKRDA